MGFIRIDIGEVVLFFVGMFLIFDVYILNLNSLKSLNNFWSLENIGIILSFLEIDYIFGFFIFCICLLFEWGELIDMLFKGCMI